MDGGHFHVPSARLPAVGMGKALADAFFEYGVAGLWRSVMKLPVGLAAA